MKTLLNTIKYGSSSIKRLLALIAVFAVAGIGCIVAAIVTGQFFFLFGTAVAVFAGISAAQSILIAGSDIPEKLPNTETTPTEQPANELIIESNETPVNTPIEAPVNVPDALTNNMQVFENVANTEITGTSDIWSAKSEEPIYVNTLDEDDGSMVKITTEYQNIPASPVAKAVPTDDSEELLNTLKPGKKSKKKKTKKKSLFSFFSKKNNPSTVESEDDELGVVRSLGGNKKSEKLTGLKKSNKKQKNKIFRDDIPKQVIEKTSVETSAVETEDYSSPNVEEFLNAYAPKAENKAPETVSDVVDDIVNRVMEESDKDNALNSLIEEEETSTERINSKQASEEVIVSYNRKKIKQTMKRYKVKRDHRLILVDKSEKYGIFQSPAFVWVDKNEFHMLLIEKEPRELVFPLYGFSNIDYLPKQTANSDVDYPSFHKDCMITRMFKEYLPDYQHSTVVGDMTALKNLYGLGGIYVTNRSAKNLFDLLPVEFNLKDKVTASKKMNIYFKDAHKANVMLKDMVYNAESYADRLSSILRNMTESTMNNNEFRDTLRLMIKYKFITEEFAKFFLQQRNINM